MSWIRPMFFLLLLRNNVSKRIFEHGSTDTRQSLDAWDIGDAEFGAWEKNGDAESRIVGGSAAHPKRFEYFVLIRVFEKDTVKRCAGSLIHSDIVLTAAHCLTKSARRVTAWVNYTHDDYLTGYEYAIKADNWIQHPDYDSETALNDVGIVKLQTPIEWVVPVSFNQNATIPEDNQHVRVFGFGVTEEAGTFPSDLMVAGVNVVPFSICNSRKFLDGRIDDESMICAGKPNGGKDACSGDSGAPLIVGGRNARQDIQVGIVSWGSGCGIANKPGVYTRISKYASWIDRMICENTASMYAPCIFSEVWQMVASKNDPSSAPVVPPNSDWQNEDRDSGAVKGKMGSMYMTKRKREVRHVSEDTRAYKLVKRFRGSD